MGRGKGCKTGGAECTVIHQERGGGGGGGGQCLSYSTNKGDILFSTRVKGKEAAQNLREGGLTRQNSSL